jgi:hypothetical protein
LLDASALEVAEVIRTVFVDADLGAIPLGPRAGWSGPVWRNDWFDGFDAAALHGFLRVRQPVRYLEVGSGHSTLFARHAIDNYGLPTTIVSIDPEPRAEVDAVCDRVVRSRLEDTDLKLFAELEAGDVLLVDGSHLALMNSDATVFFLEVLPNLPAGVLIGIDDIFLPWDYPPTWERRVYGEQYLLASALLAAPSRWSIRFPGFFATRDTALLSLLRPLAAILGRGEDQMSATSFWMECQ